MKLFKHAIVAAFILISAFSCVKGSYQTSYRAICTFEPADTVHDFSNGIYNKSDIYQGGGVLKFCSKRTDDGEFTGGFAVCCRKDTIYKEGYMPKSPFYVADTTGAAKSACYAVFYDNRGRMPEHSIEFVSRANGTCIPIGLYVVNTNLVVNTVKFGTSYGPAFKQGDWMKLTITGKRGTTTTGTVSMDLAKYDEKGLTVLTDWTAVPTDKLGAVEYIDLSIESNRYDIPTYCCIDNVVADVSLSLEPSKENTDETESGLQKRGTQGIVRKLASLIGSNHHLLGDTVILGDAVIHDQFRNHLSFIHQRRKRNHFHPDRLSYGIGIHQQLQAPL